MISEVLFKVQDEVERLILENSSPELTEWTDGNVFTEAYDILDEEGLTSEEKAERLTEADEITVRAKNKADEILKTASENSKLMKMSILDYTDNMLYNLQEKVDQMYATYFTDMYDDLQATFEKINNNISSSRSEVKEQIYKAQVGGEEKGK